MKSGARRLRQLSPVDPADTAGRGPARGARPRRDEPAHFVAGLVLASSVIVFATRSARRSNAGLPSVGAEWRVVRALPFAASRPRPIPDPCPRAAPMPEAAPARTRVCTPIVPSTSSRRQDGRRRAEERQAPEGRRSSSLVWRPARWRSAPSSVSSSCRRASSRRVRNIRRATKWRRPTRARKADGWPRLQSRGLPHRERDREPGGLAGDALPHGVGRLRARGIPRSSRGSASATRSCAMR